MIPGMCIYFVSFVALALAKRGPSAIRKDKRLSM